MVIKFELKRPKEKTSSLHTRFMLNGTPFKFNTGKSINTRNLAKNGLAVNSGEDNYILINQYLETWSNELKTIIRTMEANKERLDQKIIQDKLDKMMNRDPLKQPEGEIYDFISLMEFYIKNSNSPYENIYKLKQVREFVIKAENLIFKTNLALYMAKNKKYRVENLMPRDRDLPFHKINLDFMLAFVKFMENGSFSIGKGEQKVVKYYKTNSVNKVVKKLKEMILYAIDKKWVTHFTWNTIKCKDMEVDTVCSDFEELQAIHDTELTDIEEVYTRDIYVVNSFLGMRYSDFNEVRPHEYKKRIILGKEYIIYAGRASKTGNRVEFAIHPNAIAILEKYNYQMPKMSLNKFNATLKTVCFKAGLTGIETIREVRNRKVEMVYKPKFELMSSHAARRSFCTNFYCEGVAIAAIMSVSGHLTEQEFRKYIRGAIVRIEVVAAQISAIKGIEVLKVA